MKKNSEINFFVEKNNMYKINSLIKLTLNILILFSVAMLAIFLFLSKNNKQIKRKNNIFASNHRVDEAAKNIDEYREVGELIEEIDEEIKTRKKDYVSLGINRLMEVFQEDVLNNLIINDNKIKINAQLSEPSDYSNILTKLKALEFIDRVNSVNLDDSGTFEIDLSIKEDKIGETKENEKNKN